MRLSQILAPQVSARSRARGAAYFAAGAVAALEVTDGLIEGTVVGGQPYVVLIDTNDSRLQASCTCPYFADRFDICKHVWAVLLAAEERAIPLLTPGSAPNRVVLEPMAEDDPYDGDDDDRSDHSWPPAPNMHGRGADTNARAKTPKPAPWQQRLQQVGGRVLPTSPLRPQLSTGRLLYVIDVGASRSAQAVVIELMTRARKVNGDWAKPKTVHLSSSELRVLPDQEDRRLLEYFVGARPQYAGYDPAYGDFVQMNRVRLGDALAAELLPAIARTGRCLARVPLVANEVADKAATQPVHRWGWTRPTPVPEVATTLLPLADDDGTPWRFEVTIRRDDAGGGYLVDGHLVRDDARMALSEPLLAAAGGTLITRTHVARLDDLGAFRWLVALRQGPMSVPEQDRVALLDAILAEAPPVTDMPEALRVTIETAVPRPRLQLRPARHRAEHLEASLSWDYNGLHVPASLAAPLVRTPDATRAIRRDVAREQAAADRLRQIGFKREWGYDQEGPVQIAARHLPRVVRTLLAEDWHVEAKGFVYRTPGATALQVTSGIDWFELQGHADYGQQRVALPELLAALRRGDGFVQLDDGSLGVLPEEWLRKQGFLAELGTPAGNGLRFKPSQVALLDALLAEQPSATFDQAFARARAELQAFDGIAAADAPPAFTGTLREYQREGLGWLLFLRRFGLGGCLADDMGLGKTVMILALLSRIHAASSRDADDRRPSLVVAPRSLVFNWRQEAGRFTPGLRVLEYTGAGRTAMREAFSDYDLVLTTYGTLRRDAAHLAETSFEYAVLDESQAIKNAGSAAAKATRLLGARHRLALSGTPIENHLGELWSLFEFLNPGMLGASSAFEGVTSRSVDAESLASVARGLRPFILRRTKEQVAKELPPKTEQTLYCEMERPQRALYDELRDHYRRALLDGAVRIGLGRTKLQVLEALLRLRQAACHPGLIDKKRLKEGSAKLDVLLPRIAEAVAEGHKTLVFSQFTSLLDILRTHLDADAVVYEYLDGRTRDRQARVERFQTDDSCRLFLVSLKAGGVGLNLTAAEYVFLLDPWWNPAVEAQAIDRAHRIGQARHVFAYRLIAKDTVEERVLELQQHKRKLADAVLSADGSLLKDLKREDLELLLS